MRKWAVFSASVPPAWPLESSLDAGHQLAVQTVGLVDDYRRSHVLWTKPHSAKPSRHVSLGLGEDNVLPVVGVAQQTQSTGVRDHRTLHDFSLVDTPASAVPCEADCAVTSRTRVLSMPSRQCRHAARPRTRGHDLCAAVFVQHGSSAAFGRGTTCR